MVAREGRQSRRAGRNDCAFASAEMQAQIQATVTLQESVWKLRSPMHFRIGANEDDNRTPVMSARLLAGGTNCAGFVIDASNSRRTLHKTISYLCASMSL